MESVNLSQLLRRLLSFVYTALIPIIPAYAAKLTARIVDETGTQVEARIYLQNETGHSFFPSGTLVYKKLNWNVSEEHFIASKGEFSIDLPKGVYSLRIERGKEYLPIDDKVQISDGDAFEKTYHLRRWVSMNQLGWYSGDMHAHVRLNDATTLMQAEDLNVLLPITVWRVSFVPVYRDPLLSEFLAKADVSGAVWISKNRWFTPVNEELESDQSAILISRLGKTPLTLEFPFEEMTERARKQGALVDSEKATSVELPALAGLGGVDLVGLANNHFWRSACYTGPWGVWPDHAMKNYAQTCGGFAHAGFDLYYALLNLGTRAKLSGGSAYGVQPTPLGWSRVYVHSGPDFNPEAWFKGLREGRSFVTTGPMMLLKVNGLEPGEEYRGNDFPLHAQVELTMLSSDSVEAAEIVLNGTVHSISMMRDNSASFSFKGTTALRLDSSSWIAARYISRDRDTAHVAHTSPIYFWKQDQPIFPSEADRKYMLGRIVLLIRETKAGRSENGSDSTSNIFDNLEIRQRTLEYLEQAKKNIEAKLHHQQQ